MKTILSGLSGGAIAGISISVLVLMSMAVYFLVVLHGRKRRHKDELKVHLEDEQGNRLYNSFSRVCNCFEMAHYKMNHKWRNP